MLVRAIQFAALKHQGQLRRKSNIPYFVHPAEVMQILTANDCDEDTIIAGVLHDTIEDTDATYDEIKDIFGEHIASLVSGESEDKSKSWKVRKQGQIDSLKNDNTVEHHEICCADKLSNMRAIYHDLQTIGDEVWTKFKATKEQVQWYYKSIIENLVLVQDRPMYKELRKYYTMVFGEEI